ncbi:MULTISPECIES: subclass B3 metallo-beta-lactamase [Sphingomonas]|jgi:metallo-beta-lactamase class B|uniref:Subclass B3 metallo-beta-lactamase n=1 Tax=Sphingomonas zeae TaxID=1646122 RepID=A0A7Y6B3D0_9SPHN|nr:MULTISPECIES: subclass B3 metallo-beta-lactamase [Sphingomonas]MBB4048266.1 metallo-beta-lactamase class B [Sphingomonas zeae]MDK8186155.1 subclass B3 metallo-beta-lactamase [Sphingomonas zeae]MDK8215678.1 subclass B3 metallo-beta-lactamase [Sphingomonas sp. UMB7805-LC452B]NUU46675.1 subclass B3 metallo-beta-lactamase [Sphingomonas zeae]
MLARPTLLSLMAIAAAPAMPQASDPLTRPIVTEHTAEWLAPRPPMRVFGSTYLVGFGGLNVALIDTGKGLILIDGALPQAAPAILANVRRLGFAPRDIKYILSTEPHFDHAGGIAALARDTGATVVAGPRGAEALRTGRLAADDPQRGYDSRFPAVPMVKVIRDGERLALGNTVITARATPGHTVGSMSWSWRACEGQRCKAIVFAASLNPVSTDDYRFSAPSHKAVVAAFARGQAAMRALPCDILITAHADQDGATERYLTKPGACRAYALSSQRKLAERINSEAR